MKIIASDAIDTGAESQKVLQIANDADLAELAGSGALEGVDRIELVFPKFTDGRAFSQAVLLRRRYRFAGDLRAGGDVLIDQLLQMQRCGFDQAVLRAYQDAAHGQRLLALFTQGYYQGDVLQPEPRFTASADVSTIDNASATPPAIGHARTPSEETAS